MAPKEDKSKQAKKQKTAEDKTFGLKNKNKSKAVQQFVKQVQNSQSAQNTQKAARIAAAQGVVNPKDKRKAEEEKQKELAALFAVAIKQPKVPPGVDPKSIVCEFYRHGQCTKSFKCKFAHDLSVERKGPRIDLFQDQRDVAGQQEGDGQDKEEGMEDWDQETLERVVKEKHGSEKPSNVTTIVCKYFLEAVEKRQYGWFWKCPNGAECKYRHALPPGYVLKSQMKELLEEEARNVKDIAEQIEEERAKIDARTPINQEVFRVWRQKKVEARRAKRDAENEERRRKGIMTGREIFLQEGFTAEDDAGATGADDLRRECQDEEEEAIRQMLENARLAAERAKQSAEQDPGTVHQPVLEGDEQDKEKEHEENGLQSCDTHAHEHEEHETEAGPSRALHDRDAEEVFGGDDDDEEEIMDDDDEEEEDLDALEDGIAHMGVDSARPSK